MSRYPLSEWLAEQIRLTVFLLPGAAGLPAERWWEAIVGASAEESTANLRLGLKTLSAAFNAGKLILKLEPGRIDWLLVPRDPDPSVGPTAEFLVIGPILENLQQFSDIAERWLRRDDTPDFVRIAFGCVLIHPEADSRSAYVRLADYLPFRLGPDSSDFLLQINNPTNSGTGIEGLRINRLSKWAVMGLARVALRMEGVQVATGTSHLMAHALRIEVDINTPPDFQARIPRERLIDVYRELVRFGQSIITEGLAQ